MTAASAGCSVSAATPIRAVFRAKEKWVARQREPPRLALPGNTCLVPAVDASSSCSITSKGQVTIPKALRQQLGLGRGSRVCFELVGDHIELRPWKQQQTLPASGFGLLKSRRPPVPVDFDPASLLRP
jgi:AbrB family looped-hinge helix DNA binding protein